MRIFLTAAIALTVFAPLVSAQQDGCVEALPCLLDVEVDETGISSVSVSNMTTGDWFRLSVSNLDSRSHTVTFSGVTVNVPSYDYVDSAPFQAGAPGNYPIIDQPTGDQATIHVLSGDVVDAETKAEEGKGAPGPSIVLLAAALAAALLLRRRQ